MMAPAMTAPPMAPATIPGPHPHPRPRHWAEASVAVATTVTKIVAAPSKPTMVFFFINVSLGLMGAKSANRDSSEESRTKWNIRAFLAPLQDRGAARSDAITSAHRPALERAELLIFAGV